MHIAITSTITSSVTFRLFSMYAIYGIALVRWYNIIIKTS